MRFVKDYAHGVLSFAAPKVKNKLVFNLTKRQIICFGIRG